VAAGSVLQVSGPNGSGKSTLLRCLAGLMQPESGAIELRVDGSVLAVEERRRAVGYVAPDLMLYDELTALENLRFFCRLRRLPAGRADAALARVGLPGDRPWRALSSGMRQRLRWAWATMHRPALLILDEPFQNLDDPGSRLTHEMLEEHLDGGLAVVANPSALALPRVASRVELAG